jgi:hypothetical protein
VSERSARRRTRQVDRAGQITDPPSASAGPARSRKRDGYDRRTIRDSGTMSLPRQGETTMLTAVPKRWFSWDFTVSEGDRSIAFIDTSFWRERGVLRVDGVDHQVYRERMLGGDFILETAGAVVARAQKPSAFRRAFAIEHRGRRYTLRATSAVRRRMALFEGDRSIGALSPQGIFTRRVNVDLPPDMPMAVRVFVIWLAVILWKRDADGGAAAS